MENPYQQVGKRVRSYREQCGLTQAQLAEKTELSDNYIGLIERGLKQPSLHTLNRIAKVLEIELCELVKKAPEGTEEAESLQQLRKLLNKKSFNSAKLLLALYKTIQENTAIN